MKEVALNDIAEMAENARDDLWDTAREYGHDNPKIYLHWTAGGYDTTFDDYHLNITGDGKIYASCNDFTECLPHTWHRNLGGVGVALCCCVGGTTNDLGECPPTAVQIEKMAQVIATLCKHLWLTPNTDCVLTHGEAADNLDGDESGYGADDCYGPLNGCERWDLQFLGTDESPEYTTDYDDPATGGNVLRGKAAWYLDQWEKEGR